MIEAGLRNESGEYVVNTALMYSISDKTESKAEDAWQYVEKRLKECSDVNICTNLSTFTCLSNFSIRDFNEKFSSFE